MTPKKPLFDTVAILGLGLIGGSLALEIRHRGLARRVVGYNRSEKGRRLAKKRGACHAVSGDPVRAVREADLVILATPVQSTIPLARTIAPHLKPGALVTDVGSTKQHLVKALGRLFPSRVDFLGSHPIAGTERSGMAAAQRDLFSGRWWLLTPEGRNPREKKALARLKRLAAALGAKPATMSPGQHDRSLALISHLPHMAAYALVDTALGVDQGRALKFSAGGFRDYTRIAASSPRMWSEICLENRENILKMITRYEKSLKRIKSLLRRKDTKGLEDFFQKSARVRRKL